MGGSLMQFTIAWVLLAISIAVCGPLLDVLTRHKMKYWTIALIVNAACGIGVYLTMANNATLINFLVVPAAVLFVAMLVANGFVIKQIQARKRRVALVRDSMNTRKRSRQH